MRIALTVHKLPPQSLGGTEVYTRTLARTLAALGHAVTIFAPDAEAPSVERTVAADGVRLLRVPLPAARRTENPAAQFWHTFRDHAIEREFARFLREDAPDVVHFQHVQGVSAELIRLARGRPRLITLHDYWYFCANSQLIRPEDAAQPGPCAGPSAGCRNCVDCATARADLGILRAARPLVALPLAYRNRTLHALAQEVDLLIAPSAFLRDRYVGQGFDAERICVLENGMDLHRLYQAPAAPEFGGPRPHFGFLGSYAWMKGAHVLIDAFNRLPAGSASLTLHGSDTAFPAYAAELRAAAHHPNLRVAGPVAYESVGSVLRSFDALVVPSLWYENSPLVIQESYALGIPVIASDLGALAEKVQDGRTGRLFPPGDAAALADVLRFIVSAPQQLDGWRAQIIPPPSMEDHAARLVKLYASIRAQRAFA